MTFSAVPCDSRLRVATRYLPSAQGASGDIHAVTSTPFGTRLLIGDVMGTGEPASETGAEIVAAWQEIAFSEPSLPGVAVRLHGLVMQSSHPERFVTALMVNFTEHDWAEMVFCGHPPPLLLRGESATYVEPYPAAPPLGLLDLADGWCAATELLFKTGDRLLCYTDGVSEARDRTGQFFPLSTAIEREAREAQQAQAAQGVAETEDAQRGAALLDGLIGRLRTHVGDERATDDVLLMLVERT